MALTGSQKAYGLAQSGVERSGATRSNVHLPTVFVAIDGVQYAAARAVDAEKVVNETLVITEREGDTPNTCQFAVKGFQPTDGQDVVITLGSINNLKRLFAGTILTDTSGYVGAPANAKDDVHAIDYTWLLTRETITQRWTNVSATVIAQEIIADAGRGFTSLLVAVGLPVLDEFTVTNQTHAKALAALAERIGGYWKATYRSTVSGARADVRFGITTDTSQTDPTPITAASALLTGLKDFHVTRDLSQVITRQPVEGGGGSATAVVPIGGTSLPLDAVTWYNLLGGMVVSGPQRITYTGIGLSYPPALGAWGTHLGPTGELWTGVAWSPALELFVAVSGHSGLGAVMTSPDGLTWTQRTAAVASTWEAVAWSPSLHLFAAVSANGLVMTSPDGIAWTQRTAAEDSLWQSVVWAAGLGLFVAVANAVNTGTHQVMTSPDGITWTARTAASASQWLQVAWSPALSLLVAVAQSGSPNAVMTSPDGITWTLRTATGQTGFAVAWSPTLNLWVIVAGTQTSTSPDGITWTAHASALPAANNYKTVIWTDVGLFVALGDGSTNDIAVSADGLTWTTSTAPVHATTGRWAQAWSPVLGTLVAVGFTGALTPVLMANVVAVYPTLTGIPASGAGSVLYPIAIGDPVNLRVVVDDVAAQAVIAALMGGTDDGVIEGAVIQDGRISETEARARGAAQLALRSAIDVGIGYETHDINTHASLTIGVNLTAPACVGSFALQAVTIDGFAPSLWPTYHAEAASTRFTFADLLRRARRPSAG